MMVGIDGGGSACDRSRAPRRQVAAVVRGAACIVPVTPDGGSRGPDGDDVVADIVQIVLIDLEATAPGACR